MTERVVRGRPIDLRQVAREIGLFAFWYLAVVGAYFPTFPSDPIWDRILYPALIVLVFWVERTAGSVMADRVVLTGQLTFVWVVFTVISQQVWQSVVCGALLLQILVFMILMEPAIRPLGRKINRAV